MRIKRVSLSLLSIVAVASGCYSTHPCGAPDELVEDPAHHCYYQLKVINVDMDKYVVTGMHPRDSKTFTFRVRDLDKVGKHMTQTNETYHFIREGNSAYLELYPQEPRTSEKK
jgi:hypothetical protein